MEDIAILLADSGANSGSARPFLCFQLSSCVSCQTDARFSLGPSYVLSEFLFPTPPMPIALSIFAPGSCLGLSGPNSGCQLVDVCVCCGGWMMGREDAQKPLRAFAFGGECVCLYARKPLRNPGDGEGWWSCTLATPVPPLSCPAGAWLFSSRLPNQTTLLHVCAEVGLEKLAARLLGSPQGCAEAKREVDGRLPIHVAAEAGHCSLVQLLLGHSGLAEGTTTEELMENASCAGLSSSDGALSPCGMSHQRTPLSALSMARATGPSPLMQAPCTALLWPVKTSQDFMAHSPITPPIPVSWPNEPTEAASTPEARISACRSSARGDQMVTENDLSGENRQARPALQ